jgi:hypothetical protein
MRTPTPRRRAVTHAVLVAVPLVIAVVVGCSSGSSNSGDDTAAGGDGDGEADSTTQETVVDVEAQASDFKPLSEMTPVREFFVDNVAGDLEATLEVANDPEGGTYPIGTVIQLIPTEAMIKRAPGFDPDSNDWEFFRLGVSADGTVIEARGGSEVVNGFTGTSCAGCHSAAEPQFDFVCEDDHGCEPLPFGDDVIRGIQESDPRPPAA